MVNSAWEAFLASHTLSDSCGLDIRLVGVASGSYVHVVALQLLQVGGVLCGSAARCGALVASGFRLMSLHLALIAPLLRPSRFLR